MPGDFLEIFAGPKTGMEFEVTEKQGVPVLRVDALDNFGFEGPRQDVQAPTGHLLRQSRSP